MRASRTPFPPLESYWAGDVVTGVGKGTSSLFYEIGQGIGGLVVEPYRGAQQNGFLGLSWGIFKGIGGLIIRPIKGGFDFITQPLIGIIYTPHCIYRKLTTPYDTDTIKEINFKLFGMDQCLIDRARLRMHDNTGELSDEASVLMKSSHGEVSVYIGADDTEQFDESQSLLSKNDRFDNETPKKLRKKKKSSTSKKQKKGLNNDSYDSNLHNLGDQDNREPQYPVEAYDFKDFSSSSGMNGIN